MLVLSTVFGRGHKRVGQPTHFVESMQAGTKLHTIRANTELWRRRAAKIDAGEMELSIRVWSGRPYRSQQVEVARLTQLHVQSIEAVMGATDALPRVWIDGQEVADVEQVARNEGLELADWVGLFLKRTNHYEGVVLQFGSFRY